MGLHLAKVSSADCNMMITARMGEMRHGLPLNNDSDTPHRPRYNIRNALFGASGTEVTVHEQNMIYLISSFSPTYTTEGGRTFVENLSSFVTAEELSIPDMSGQCIMWPTHPPDDNEILNGDYGSTTNWKFAVVLHLNIRGTTRVQIIATLYPEVERTREGEGLAITFDTPS